ncbi:MAG: benzoate/H(+) symporter BenE family transporter [Gammaproteobacteria bacterium]|nr:benzoate/H(+) symporter BenE family transporter [Gammaproteobacteria bacterium]
MRNLFSLPFLSTGLVTVLVGYSSAAAIVLQAAAASGANPEQMGSWMWALGIGMGASTIALSAWFRTPIVIAWSTPGAALLITSLPGIPMQEAIGAFLFSSFLISLCGISGWAEKIIQWVPQSIACAMLAGLLLQFVLRLFLAWQSEFLLVALMLITYLLGARHLPRYAILLSFLVGLACASASGLIHASELTLTASLPVFTTASFRPSTLMSVGLPLFIVTMSSQNIPGISALRAHGYNTPSSVLITWTGLTGMLLAPFGGFAFNLSAITAAICMDNHVHSNPQERYPAAIWAGVFYVAMGICGATLVQLFDAIPNELMIATAGLALLTTVGNSLQRALQCNHEREAALLTFALTASGFTLFSIGSAFWGLVIGLLVLRLIPNTTPPSLLK